MKFSIPFFVGASFCLVAFDPDVFLTEPSVKNLKNGPRARVIEVLIGDSISSDCLMVGATVI